MNECFSCCLPCRKDTLSLKAMRYLSADIIYPLHRAPTKEGVLVLDDGW